MANQDKAPEAKAREARAEAAQGQVDEQALAEASLSEREARLLEREAAMAAREAEAVTHAARLPRARGGGFVAKQQENGTYVVGVRAKVSSVDDLVAKD